MKNNNISLLFFLAGILPIFQLLLGLLNPYNYYPLSASTTTFISVHTVIFFIIYLVTNGKIAKFNTINNFEDNYSLIPNQLTIATKIIFFYEFLFFLLTLTFGIKNDLSLQDIRNLFFFGSLYGTDYSFGQIVIFFWIIQGIKVLLLVRICTAFLLRPNKKSSILFLMISFAFIFNDLATGGRINIFYLVCIIYIIKFFIGNKNISRYGKRILNRVFWLTVLAVLSISILRLEDNHSLVSFSYKYFVGPIFIFDQAILDSNGIAANDELRFGTIFSSLDWATVGMLKALNFCDCKTLAAIVDPIMATGYYFSDNDGGNAFFTGFFSFFLDFGLLGAVASGALCSLSLYLSINRFNKFPSLWSFYFAIIIIFINYMMIRENALSSPWILFSLVFGLLFLPKNKRNINLPSSINKPIQKQQLQ